MSSVFISDHFDTNLLYTRRLYDQCDQSGKPVYTTDREVILPVHGCLGQLSGVCQGTFYPYMQ